MLKGQLKHIVLCGSKPAPGCRNEFDAMARRVADPEQPVRDSAGNTRSMYVYLPASGVIPCSSGIVVMRDGGDEDSARQLLERTGWAECAERDHYVVLLPNPAPGGWNLPDAQDGPDDIAFARHWVTTATQQYLLGCKAHRTSIYLAGFGRAASLAAGMVRRYGALLAGVYLENAAMPMPESASSFAPAPAWLVDCDEKLEQSIGDAAKKAGFGYRCFHDPKQPLYRQAWDALFLGLRRWPTGGNGTVTHKSAPEEMGLTTFEHETFLGDNGELPHTWYEFAPFNPTGEKLPLVLCLHGGGTSARYCAEQNRWHELGAKYGFYVVYPHCCANAVWNAGCDPECPSDEEYLLALYRYLMEKYPIDPGRVYCTGFSMGSLMTQCMGMLHGELFAAIAPFSGYLFPSYWEGPETNEKQPFELTARRLAWMQQAQEDGRDTRMPAIQFHGDCDNTWDGDAGVRTRSYWAQRNQVAEPDLENPTCREGADQRFSVHDCCNADGTSLYRFVSVAGLPHAVDLRQPQMAWTFLSAFSRNPDGSLQIRDQKSEITK